MIWTGASLEALCFFAVFHSQPSHMLVIWFGSVAASDRLMDKQQTWTCIFNPHKTLQHDECL